MNKAEREAHIRDEFSEFMKNELVRYIHQEVRKGHALIAVKSLLLKGGHHTDLVDECIRILKKNHFNLELALREPVSKPLKKQLYYEVLNAVIRYIEHMLSQGYTIHEIESILYKYGHTKDVVEAAIDEVIFGKKPSKPGSNRYVGKVILPIEIAVVAVFIFIVAASANESITLVFQGFMPLFFSVLLSGAAAEKADSMPREAVWLIPVVLAGLFYAVGRGAFPLMDVEKLAVLNLLFSLVLASFVALALPPATRKPSKKNMPGRKGKGGSGPKEKISEEKEELEANKEIEKLIGKPSEKDLEKTIA